MSSKYSESGRAFKTSSTWRLFETLIGGFIFMFFTRKYEELNSEIKGLSTRKIANFAKVERFK